jgi:hypothetical protein
MPAALGYYTDEVAVPAFTQDNTQRLVDFSSIVSEDANGVILHALNTLSGGGNPQSFNYEAVEWTINIDGGIVPYRGAAHAIVPLDGLQRCWLWADSEIKVTVLGETRAPGFVWHSDPLPRSPLTEAQVGVWYARAVYDEGHRPDSIEAAVLVNAGSSSNVADIGCKRNLGSMSQLFTSDQWERTKWFITRVYNWFNLNATYQIYTTGKFTAGPPDLIDNYSLWWELGFVLKGYGFKAVEDPVDQAVSPVLAWTTETVSGGIPAGAEGIVGILRSTATRPAHGLRAVGSTNPVVEAPGNTSFWHGSELAELTSGDYQYWLGAVPGLFIYAYTLPLAELDLASGELVLDPAGDPIVRQPLTAAGADVVLGADGDPLSAALVSGQGDLVISAAGDALTRAYLSGLGELVLTAAGDVIPRAYLDTVGADVVLDAAGDPQARAYISGSGELVLTAAGDAQARAYISGSGELVLTAAGDVVLRAYLDTADADLVLAAAGDPQARAYISGSGELVLTAAGDVLTAVSLIPAGADLVLTAAGDAQARAYLSGSGELVLTAAGDAQARAYISGSGELVLAAAGDPFTATLMELTDADLVLGAAGDTLTRAYISGLGELVLNAAGEVVPRSYLDAADADLVLAAAGDPFTAALMELTDADLVLGAAGDTLTRAYISGLGELVLDAAGEVVPRSYLDAAGADVLLTAAGDVALGARLVPTGAGVVIVAAGDTLFTRVLVSGLAELVLDASGQPLVPLDPCHWIWRGPERRFIVPEEAQEFAILAAGGWRVAEGAQEFAVPAAGAWRTAEGAQEFAVPAAGGWYEDEDAEEFTAPADSGWREDAEDQDLTTPADEDWQTRKPCG